MSVSMSAERVPDRQLVGTPAPQPGRGGFRKAEKENRASPMMNNSIPLSSKRRDEHFAKTRVGFLHFWLPEYSVALVYILCCFASRLACLTIVLDVT